MPRSLIRSTFKDGSRRWLQIALTALAVLPAFWMWHVVASHWVRLPFWDEWHTPGQMLEAWAGGHLSFTELFSQHNESRKFFPRLLYLLIAALGGWDPRHEMRLLFASVCALALLLRHLLRQTPGATPLAVALTWPLLTLLCFAPVQAPNFLWGIQLEPFFPGIALLAAAAINLSALSFRAKTLANLTLALVATYTFANGMLLWLLAWPLPSPNEKTSLGGRRLWSALFAGAGMLAVGGYFVGYRRPGYHPSLAFHIGQLGELAHYFVLWIGRYFASDFFPPFALGLGALAIFLALTAFALWEGKRTGNWRTFYPWLCAGAYACGSGAITALGRVGFGVEQALEVRYTVFTLFFYLSVVGLAWAIYQARFRISRPAVRASAQTNAVWFAAILLLLWSLTFAPNLAAVTTGKQYRRHLLRALEWIEPIPHNPDLALIFPDVAVLRDRARRLAGHRILRLPFVRGTLAAQVQQAPDSAASMHGEIQSCVSDGQGHFQVRGWAWLPEKAHRADCVVVGWLDLSGHFQPANVFETGGGVRGRPQEARFSGWLAAPPGSPQLAGWAVDLHAEKAWPLGHALPVPGP